MFLNWTLFWYKIIKDKIFNGEPCLLWMSPGLKYEIIKGAIIYWIWFNRMVSVESMIVYQRIHSYINEKKIMIKCSDKKSFNVNNNIVSVNKCCPKLIHGPHEQQSTTLNLQVVQILNWSSVMNVLGFQHMLIVLILIWKTWANIVILNYNH